MKQSSFVPKPVNWSNIVHSKARNVAKPNTETERRRSAPDSLTGNGGGTPNLPLTLSLKYDPTLHWLHKEDMEFGTENGGNGTRPLSKSLNERALSLEPELEPEPEPERALALKA